MDGRGSGRPKHGFLERRIGVETVLYDRAAHRAHCLGPVAVAVWRSWEPGVSPAELLSRVEVEVGEPVEDVAVELALRRLGRAGLVDEGFLARGGATGADRHPAAGRRAALRRVAAMAGLAVASLAVPAPEAVAATCTRDLGQTCQLSSECCPTANGNPTCCGQLLRRCLPAGIANCGP